MKRYSRLVFSNPLITRLLNVCLSHKLAACRTFVVAVLLASLSGFAAAAPQKTLVIGLDADRSHNLASAQAIEMGIKTAFSEIDYKIQGYGVEFIAFDHRGNAARSKVNYQKAFDRSSALLMIAGMHSPPLIKNRQYINENGLLTLVPWAAAGPITRSDSNENWIFRLSIDDSKAGQVIAQYAVEQKQCKSPHLLLEQTPWGQSNLKTMNRALKQLTSKEAPVTWFNWSVSEANLKIKIRAAIENGATCLFFVGNTQDGKTLAEAMHQLDLKKALPVFSHWGITGGDFHTEISHEKRQKMHLSFIQTCFSFLSSSPTSVSEAVEKQFSLQFPKHGSVRDINAPAGFIHGYDLGKILIQAITQVQLEDNAKHNRKKIKAALESLQTPIPGLIKTYDKPFAPYTKESPDAHEALGPKHFCMAHYDQSGKIVVDN